MRKTERNKIYNFSDKKASKLHLLWLLHKLLKGIYYSFRSVRFDTFLMSLRRRNSTTLQQRTFPPVHPRSLTSFPSVLPLAPPRLHFPRRRGTDRVAASRPVWSTHPIPRKGAALFWGNCTMRPSAGVESHRREKWLSTLIGVRRTANHTSN